MLQKLQIALFPKNRSKSYKTILEVIPLWVWFLSFIAFNLLIVGCTLLPLFFSPQISFNSVHDSQVGFDGVGFLSGKSEFNGSISGLTTLNQRLSIRMYLKNNLLKTRSNKDSLYSWTMRNFQIAFKLEGKLGNNQWELMEDFNRVHHHRLVCYQNRVTCRPVNVVVLDHLEYSDYRVSVQLRNPEEFVNENLLEPFVSLSFRGVNSEFSQWEIVYKSVFLGMAIPFTLFYLGYLLFRQQYHAWRSEQLFVLLLLVFTILYDNPLYFMDFVIRHWIFSFINLIFGVSYFSFLMLTFLVVTHGIIKVKNERSFLWFYLPKITIVGSFWLFSIIVLSYIRFNEVNDESFIADYERNYTIVVFYLIILAIYILNLGFYFVRILGLLQKLPVIYMRKFLGIWGLTLVVLWGTILDIVLAIFQPTSASTGFLTLMTLYNFYGFYLAILFLPSTQGYVTNDSKKEEEEEILLENAEEDFENFN